MAMSIGKQFFVFLRGLQGLSLSYILEFQTLHQ
jgi:hypothetical protein